MLPPSSWRESGALGNLTNTGGLVELVVLAIGLDLGVISPTRFTMMVVMALVTTVMTTLALALAYPRTLVRVARSAGYGVAAELCASPTEAAARRIVADLEKLCKRGRDPGRRRAPTVRAPPTT